MGDVLVLLQEDRQGLQEEQQQPEQGGGFCSASVDRHVQAESLRVSGKLSVKRLQKHHQRHSTSHGN